MYAFYKEEYKKCKLAIFCIPKVVEKSNDTRIKTVRKNDDGSITIHGDGKTFY